MRHYQEFDIGFDCIVTDPKTVKVLYIDTDFTKHRGPFWIPQQYFRKDLVDFLGALDITVHQMILLGLGAEGPDPHCDDPGPGDWGRMAWWESDQVDMMWYDLLPGQSHNMVIRPLDGAPCYMAREHQVQETHRVRLSSTRPAIVSTGVLHTGHNHGAAPWAPYAWGWQIVPFRDGRPMTDSELAESLKQYLVN